MADEKRNGFITFRDVFTGMFSAAIVIVSLIVGKFVAPIEKATAINQALIEQVKLASNEDFKRIEIRVKEISSEFLRKSEATVAFESIRSELLDIKIRLRDLEKQRRADVGSQNRHYRATP